MPDRKHKKIPLNVGKMMRVDAMAQLVMQHTKFTFGEAKSLVLIHHKMEAVGPVDCKRFREFIEIVFGITDEVMLEFLFRHFDRDHDGAIDDFEFCRGMSTMIRGGIEAACDFTYSIYDINGDGSLARDELAHCLKGCIYSGYGVEEDEVEDCERDIVELTMRKLDTDRDGLITKEDFKSAVMKDPLLLQTLGQCLPSAQCKAAFLGTFTEKHRTYTPDYPNISSEIKKLDNANKRGRRKSKTALGIKYNDINVELSEMPSEKQIKRARGKSFSAGTSFISTAAGSKLEAAIAASSSKH